MHIDTYPLPLIEQASSALLGRKYFSTIDMYSGFWQVKIAPEDKMKTAFQPHQDITFAEVTLRAENFPIQFSKINGCSTQKSHRRTLFRLH
jgi:hypothetical protein